MRFQFNALRVGWSMRAAAGKVVADGFRGGCTGLRPTSDPTIQYGVREFGSQRVFPTHTRPLRLGEAISERGFVVVRLLRGLLAAIGTVAVQFDWSASGVAKRFGLFGFLAVALRWGWLL